MRWRAPRQPTAACDVESESREKQLAASHRVGDGADYQSCQGARDKPHRNGCLNDRCLDTQAIGDDCYRWNVSRDRKLTKRDQSGQQEQDSPWGRMDGGDIRISHDFILSACRSYHRKLVTEGVLDTSTSPPKERYDPLVKKSLTCGSGSRPGADANTVRRFSRCTAEPGATGNPHGAWTPDQQRTTPRDIAR
jgi:hypothetical protein